MISEGDRATRDRGVGTVLAGVGDEAGLRLVSCEVGGRSRWADGRPLRHHEHKSAVLQPWLVEPVQQPRAVVWY